MNLIGVSKKKCLFMYPVNPVRHDILILHVTTQKQEVKKLGFKSLKLLLLNCLFLPLIRQHLQVFVALLLGTHINVIFSWQMDPFIIIKHALTLVTLFLSQNLWMMLLAQPFSAFLVTICQAHLFPFFHYHLLVSLNLKYISGLRMWLSGRELA